MSTPLQAIVFDLGNVLLEIDFDRAFAHWSAASGIPQADIRERWQVQDDIAAHETGAISDAEFFARLDMRLGTDIGSHHIETGWQQIFVGLLDPVVSLLPQLAARWPLHIFSNTNAAHTPVWQARFGSAVLPHVQRVYLSHEIGRRKPDVDSFRWLAEDLDIAPQALLFLDDSAANIEGASRAGLRTLHVTDAAAAGRQLAAIFDG